MGWCVRLYRFIGFRKSGHGSYSFFLLVLTSLTCRPGGSDCFSFSAFSLSVTTSVYRNREQRILNLVLLGFFLILTELASFLRAVTRNSLTSLISRGMLQEWEQVSTVRGHGMTRGTYLQKLGYSATRKTWIQTTAKKGYRISWWATHFTVHGCGTLVRSDWQVNGVAKGDINKDIG